MIRPSYRLWPALSPKPLIPLGTTSYFRFQLRTRGGAASIFWQQSTRVLDIDAALNEELRKTSCCCCSWRRFPSTDPSLLSLPTHHTHRIKPTPPDPQQLCVSQLVRAKRSSVPCLPVSGRPSPACHVADPLVVCLEPPRVCSRLFRRKLVPGSGCPAGPDRAQVERKCATSLPLLPVA